jgi:hypothetical protein
MPVQVESLRKEIESKFVGFSPSTNQVKPVHIASGLYRALLEESADTELLNRFVVSQTDKGKVPVGHELSRIFGRLKDRKAIDEFEIKQTDLTPFRIFLKRVVNADSGVYLHAHRMEAYTAVYKAFAADARLHYDGGEFIAEWLKKMESPLASEIVRSLNEADDTITTLCLPLLSDEYQAYSPNADILMLPFLNGQVAPKTSIHDGLLEATSSLAEHIKDLPNKLLGNRLAVSFACFALVRHLSDLEVVWGQADHRLPFLLDFSHSESDPIARVSSLTYTMCCQSISRFYGWAFSELLRKYVGIKELRADNPPTYKDKSSPEIIEVWKMALDSKQFEKEPYLTCGQALYDSLALEAEGNPIGYLKQLGHRSGLLYPPTNLKPTKRFLLQLDMFEMLIRGSVRPGEVIGLTDLQDRLWHRYGIIVGGTVQDEERLMSVGVFQADSVALDENQKRFMEMLNRLGFANLLADGVLQVEMEEVRA